MSAATKPRPFRLTPPASPCEHDRQKVIADVLRLEIAPPGRVSAAGVVWWAIDAADYGGAVPGTRTGRGMIAGVADLFFLWRGLAFFIELKREDGAFSDAQKSVSSAVLASGGRVGMARTADEVLILLDAWSIPRNRRVRVAA